MSDPNKIRTTMRVTAATKERIAEVALQEHRDQLKQLDVIVDAGLRALGHRGLWDEPKGQPKTGALR